MSVAAAARAGTGVNVKTVSTLVSSAILREEMLMSAMREPFDEDWALALSGTFL